VAQDDEFGRRIQDMNLVTPKRAKKEIRLALYIQPPSKTI